MLSHKENMQSNRRRILRYLLVFFFMTVLFLFLVFFNICRGSVSLSFREILSVLCFRRGESTAFQIIWQIRLPRVCMAAVLGGALALAGYLLQTFFHNPIAGPYILGISSGARLAVALTLILLLKYLGSVSSAALVGAALLGSFLSILFVLLLAKKLPDMSILLIGGIMIGYICSALTDFLVTFADDADIVNLHSWSLGSFSGADWEDVRLSFLLVAIAFLCTILLSKPLGAYLLGEAYAKSMGVSVSLFRVALILLSGVLAACVTAFAGPISFVGIAVPYLVKQCLGTARPILVIPAVFFGGSVFCMFCDLLARTMFAPMELNISTVTAALGAPVVIFMLFQRKEQAA